MRHIIISLCVLALSMSAVEAKNLTDAQMKKHIIGKVWRAAGVGRFYFGTNGQYRYAGKLQGGYTRNGNVIHGRTTNYRFYWKKGIIWYHHSRTGNHRRVR